MRNIPILQDFHRTLAEMCRAGVPLGRGLRSLAEELDRGPLRDAAAAMAGEIEEGTPPAEAWRRRSDLFPPLYAALVEAGVAAGDLPGTLGEIARHAALRADTARRLRRAFAYPAIVLVVLGVVSTAVFALVLPQITGLFVMVEEWSGTEFRPPVLTSFLADHPWIGLLPPVFVASGFALLGLLRRPVDGLHLPLTLLDRLPILGPLRLHASLMVLASTLALLLRRRVPAHHALTLAAAVCGHAGLGSAAHRAAEDVRGGASLAAAARTRGLLPPSLLWLLGGDAGRPDIDAALEDVARIEGERFERGLEGFTWALEPVFQVCAGALVLLLLLAVYAPILDMSSALWRFHRY